MIPKFFRDDCSFCGVFDGTVGEHAAEFVNQTSLSIFVHILKNSDGSVDLSKSPATQSPGPGQKEEHDSAIDGGATVSDEVAVILREGIKNTFLSTDNSLIEMCAEINTTTLATRRDGFSVEEFIDGRARWRQQSLYCAYRWLRCASRMAHS